MWSRCSPVALRKGCLTLSITPGTQWEFATGGLLFYMKDFRVAVDCLLRPKLKSKLL